MPHRRAVVVPAWPAISTAFPAPGTHPLKAAVSRRLSSALTGFVRAEQQGVTAAVVTARGRWVGAAGRDGQDRPLQPNSVLAIGHITHSFIAAEVLRLARAGAINLDLPVNHYLSLPFDHYGPTVRQLLTMRSGFPNWDTQEIVDAVIAHPTEHFTPHQTLSYATDPATKPGDYREMPTDYTVLGMLIEHVTHLPLAQVLRADLLRPAALARVSTQDAERPATPRAAPDTSLQLGPPTPYLPNRAAASATWADSGMAADAASVARWGYLLYGSRVQPPASTRLMTTFTNTPDGGYGIATYGVTVQHHPAVGQRGVIIGFTSELIVFPHEHISIAILMTGFQNHTTTIIDTLSAAALTAS